MRPISVVFPVNEIGHFRTDEEREQGLMRCPRCLGFLPLRYCGALSRRDNRTEICSQCGTIEGIRDIKNLPPENPETDWPVKHHLGPNWS